MLSKNKAKFIRSLQLRKYRQKYHKITVEGVKIVNDLLLEGLARVDMICATESWLSEFGESLPPGIEVIESSDKDLAGISSLKTPNEVIAVVEIPKSDTSTDVARKSICLYLDAVRDPGNLGTIIRTADWFGIKHVFLSPDCVDLYNPKVIQSSMSSIFRVSTTTLERQKLISANDVELYATSLNGHPISEITPPESGIIIMGNESQGISSELQERAQHKIKIPGDKSLGAESLNVAVATAVVLAWAAKC